MCLVHVCTIGNASCTLYLDYLLDYGLCSLLTLKYIYRYKAEELVYCIVHFCL